MSSDDELLTNQTRDTAAAGAAVAASVTAWLLLGKLDLTMILNGGLAGLVAITAPCGFVSVPSSLIIGLLAHVRDRLEPPQVPAEEEHAGLDIGEHGISAYPEFRISGAGTASAAMDVSTSRVGTPAVERAR